MTPRIYQKKRQQLAKMLLSGSRDFEQIKEWTRIIRLYEAYLKNKSNDIIRN